MKLEKIIESPNKLKKWRAIFKDGDKTKHTDFGAKGMDDYTITKDKEQQQRYINRHRSAENWSKPDSAGALSRYVLWSATTLSEGIQNYKHKFNL